MGDSEEKESTKAVQFQIEEDLEGQHAVCDDYFFNRIGNSIPLLSHSSPFDLQSPPSRPLAVSHLHRLIFLAHPSGFLAARTKDVMEAAGAASSCIQDLCVADVPVGKVDILSISADGATLAACVASRIHFFTVSSLLNKDLKPSLSCSLSEPNIVKDMLWTTRLTESSYLVLSKNRELYHGSLASVHLKHVMDEVDAAEWSPKGKFFAVARENAIIILSSKFKERLRINLTFTSWLGDSDDGCVVKVDSIKWVRPDTIIIGCLQQTGDGKEENYLLQVLKSKDGKFTNISSKPVVISFYDLFSGLIDDIIPYGSGPYLFLSYLEQCGLAVVANRKNVDQHVVLLDWSVEDGTDEIAVVDFNRDGWQPRIELQGDGDDNLIMGMCVDKNFLEEKFIVEVGMEEQKEISPFCMLICVTLEGKLVMFHVGSLTGNYIPPSVDSALQDEEDIHGEIPAASDHSNLSFGLVEPTIEQIALGSQLQKGHEKDLIVTKGGEIPTQKDPMPSDVSQTSTAMLSADPISHNCTMTKSQEMHSLEKFKSVVADGQKKVPATNMYQDKDVQQISYFGSEKATLGLSSLNNSNSEKPGFFATGSSKTEITNSNTEKPGFFATGSSKTEITKFSGLGYGPSLFPGKVPSNDASLVKSKDVQKDVKLVEESAGRFTPNVLRDAVSQSQSSGKVMSSEVSESRFLFQPSSVTDGDRFPKASTIIGAANVPSDLVQKPFHLKDTSAGLSSQGVSVRPTLTGGQRASTGVPTIESLPSMHSSHLLPQEDFVSGMSPNPRSYSLKDEYLPNLPKQPGNVQEKVKELDALLECITKAGGFRDACTVSLRSSVEALEERMQTLSERCSFWKGLMDGRLEEVQHLLDKTVQVLARKMYIDGIVKQALDDQYWEFWNSQKLGSELELKRQSISKLNQELTNQLIELERHFNTLELQRFGESGGVHIGRRAVQDRYVPSRHIQSLHSLHNTMSLQLAAAEQLSENLSKQMAVLSIGSPVKQNNVKKELFETIGIPYDSSFSSPDITKFGDSSSLKQLSLSSGSAATKHQSRRRQSSALLSADSETSRRRRDSLDKSWANFEPTKTTVKRMLLQDSQKTSVNRSPFLMGKSQFGPSIPHGSAVTSSEYNTSPSTSWYSSGSNGIEHVFPKHVVEKKSTPSIQVNGSPLQSEPSHLRFPILPSNSAALASISPSQVSPMIEKNHTSEIGNMVTDKSSSSIPYINQSGSLLISETKSMQQSGTGIHKKSSVSEALHAQTPFLLKKNEIPFQNEGTVLTSSTSGSMESGPKGPQKLSDSLGKSYDSPYPSVGTQISPSLPGKVSHFNFVTGKSQPEGKLASSSALSVSQAVSSQMVNDSSSSSGSTSSTLNSSAAMPFGKSFSSPKATTDVIGTDSSNSLSSVSPFQGPLRGSVSFQAPKMVLPSYSQPSTLASPKKELEPSLGMTTSVDPVISPLPSESLKTEPQPPIGKTLPSVEQTPSPSAPGLPSKDDATASHSEPEPPAFSLKVGSPMPSISTAEISIGLPSGSQSSFNDMVNLASNVTMNAQPEQPPTAQVLFNAPLSTSNGTTSGKNDTLEAATTEEDEMEEEASDASNTNDLSLGNLGSFGIGSTPTPTSARANPFGVVGTNQSTSSFTMTVPSGQLFRPASFSFQSPQLSQSSPPNMGAFSGSFGSGTGIQAPTQSPFGQPAQIGGGQQALGSVLGAFGQSRQLGMGSPGGSFASSSSFGGGFAGTSAMGGFPSASTSSGFAAAASTGGGFAAAATTGSGFAAAASTGGGFAAAASTGGGFAAAASTGGGFAGLSSAGGVFGGMASGGGGGFSGSAMGGGFAGSTSSGGFGGGFGAFGSQQGAGGFSGFGGNMGGGQQGASGFSAFSGNSGASGTPSGLFTQMRR